jgi:hypothetical protein
MGEHFDAKSAIRGDMKRLKPLWDDVTSFENLLKAARATLSQGRRYRGEGARFQFQLEHHVLCLQEQLRNRSYRHGSYRGFTVYEPKKRLILAAPVRDRIVHHAVHDVVAPLVDRGFIFDSYACRKGKGTHRALDRAQKFMQSNDFFLRFVLPFTDSFKVVVSSFLSASAFFSLLLIFLSLITFSTSSAF